MFKGKKDEIKKEAKKTPKKKVDNAPCNFESYLSTTGIDMDKYAKAYIESKYRGESHTIKEWDDIVKNPDQIKKKEDKGGK